MKRLLFVIVFLVCACGSGASGIDFSSDGSGKPHPDYMVDAEHIARLPHWSLKDGPPPLEFNEALQLVRALVQKKFPDKDWRLRQAFLRRKEDPEATIAYYEFRVDLRRKEVRDSWEQSWEIIILMDGTVLASASLGS